MWYLIWSDAANAASWAALQDHGISVASEASGLIMRAACQARCGATETAILTMLWHGSGSGAMVSGAFRWRRRATTSVAICGARVSMPSGSARDACTLR